MKTILFALIALSLTGCYSTGDSPSYITYFLNEKYDGVGVNQFFLDYGYPAGVFEKTKGNKIYSWVSTRYNVMPKQVVPVDYYTPGGHYEVVDSYRGITERYFCGLRIYTDAADVIRDFVVAVDSTGKFGASRCSEIFN
jgi:hypothetical protein